MTRDLTIGEVARSAGMRPSALRYYESVGLLSPARRVSGRRRYDEIVLEHLAFIKIAQQAGFTVQEIHTLIHGFEPSRTPSARWRELATKKLPEIEALIERATTMKRILQAGIHCGCASLDECTLPENVSLVGASRSAAQSG